MRWRPRRANKNNYKEICAEQQKRERQLEREHRWRTCQRIRFNPSTYMSKALKLNARRRARQLVLYTTNGTLLRPKQFVKYLNSNMEGANGLEALPFTEDEHQHTHNTIVAIRNMENNKAIGTDGAHVEMMKKNAPKTAKLLTGIWKTVDRCRIVPPEWIEGIVVPLFKGKGTQADPANSRPLTILSHIQKITEEAVVLEFYKQVTTDRAQFGFLAGVQVIQAALSVLAALRSAALFIAVLELSKTYDSVLQQLLLEKLRQLVDENLTNQLLFIPTNSQSDSSRRHYAHLN